MAQRTVALYNGNPIGIESIYTVVDGKQINIPDKVEALRRKSRNNQLFCSCGCGANLTLVAGDRNLREQHFRLKDGEYAPDCHMHTEGKCSVNSKIVLKCWLDDKLHDPGILSRVPICAVDDTNRKYEFTLLSKEKSIAVSYVYDRINLSDEKFDILEKNSKDIRLIYIVDKINANTNGQYPEFLMKIQQRQGYCLYLSIEDIDYYKAELRAVFFAENVLGLWSEFTFAIGKISEFEIDEKGALFIGGHGLLDLLSESKRKFEEEQISLKKKREREAAEREERIRRFLIAEEKRKEEERKLQEEQKKEQERQKEEAEKRRIEFVEARRIESEKQEQERYKRSIEFQKALDDGFTQQDKPIRDAAGIRWIKCKYCRKIAKESEFVSYGGAGMVNLGTCYDCRGKHNEEHETSQQQEPEKKKFNYRVCPLCGGQLREKRGQYGAFLGCSNYPQCRYTLSSSRR